LHGFNDARMRAAAADVALEGLFDFGLRGVGILLEKRNAAHDHPRGAVSALEGFGVEESLLDRMQSAGVFEAFDGGDGFSGGCGNWSDAGTPSDPIKQNSAGATLAFAAAVLGTGQAEFIAKNREQRTL
jgi:hypothetical protein